MYTLIEKKNNQLLFKNITKEIKVINIKTYEENTEVYTFIKENIHQEVNN